MRLKTKGLRLNMRADGNLTMISNIKYQAQWKPIRWANTGCIKRKIDVQRDLIMGAVETGRLLAWYFIEEMNRIN